MVGVVSGAERAICLDGAVARVAGVEVGQVVLLVRGQGPQALNPGEREGMVVVAVDCVVQPVHEVVDEGQAEKLSKSRKKFLATTYKPFSLSL